MALPSPRLAPVTRATCPSRRKLSRMRFGSIRLSLRLSDHPADARWLAAIAVLFAASRLLCYAAGMRFDLDPLRHFWQFLDPLLLRTRLAERLFYLHSQPSLFNLFLGLVL